MPCSFGASGMFLSPKKALGPLAARYAKALSESKAKKIPTRPEYKAVSGRLMVGNEDVTAMVNVKIQRTCTKSG